MVAEKKNVVVCMQRIKRTNINISFLVLPILATIVSAESMTKQLAVIMTPRISTGHMNIRSTVELNNWVIRRQK